jgi:hypothetical protein
MKSKLGLIFNTQIKRINFLNKFNNKIYFKLPNFSFCDLTSNNNVKHGKCFKCGKLGHISRECSEKVNVCYKCGKAGHISKHCSGNNKLEAQSKEQVCLTCKQKGHSANECPNKKE